MLSIMFMVPVAGLEPARIKNPTDFKSVMSTIPSHRHSLGKYKLFCKSQANKIYVIIKHISTTNILTLFLIIYTN